MDVEIVTTIERLEVLAPEWAALCVRAGAAPFQSPAWLIPLRRVYNDGGLIAVACREGGALVGFVTLVDHGSGVACLGGAISDYAGGAFDINDSAKAAAAMLAALANRGVKTIDLARLPENSPWLADFPGWGGGIEPDESCPVLVLNSAALEASIPARQATKLRYYGRRAARLGPVRIERATDANADEFLNDLFRLHAARWHDRGGPGVLAGPDIQRFHRAAVPALARAGLLRLYRLFVGARAAAVLYGLAGRRRAYYYLGGFDPELQSISPGALIVGHAIEEAIREGAEEFDFLRGREPYKYLWGAEDRATYRRTLRRIARDARGEYQGTEAAPW